MRYIDTSTIVVPSNWTSLAQAQGKNPLWSYFKKDFESLIGKKCWYSECENSGAINPIDHYRPKAATVKKLTLKNADLDQLVWDSLDVEERLGYPYLELEFSNYRYTCDISNSLNKSTSGKSKGKSNFFPLQLASPHSNSLATTGNEIVALLDPCNISDPCKLFFTSTGLVESHFSITNGSWEFNQVMVSIELYHLHYYVFIDKRKEVWNSCKEHIELIDLMYGKPDNNVAENRNLAFHIRSLQKRIEKRSEFSATAIDCIRFYKNLGLYQWIDAYFPDNSLSK